MEDELYLEDEVLTTVDTAIDITAIMVGLLTGVAIASVVNAKLPVARTALGAARNALALSGITCMAQMMMTGIVTRELSETYRLVKTLRQ